MEKVTHIWAEQEGEKEAWISYDCFCAESTEHWIRMFASKRFDCVRDCDRWNFGLETESELKKAYEKYRKDYIRGFAREMLKFVEKKKSLMRSKPKKEDK